MTLMRTTQVNPAEEPFAMLSGKKTMSSADRFPVKPTGEHKESLNQVEEVHTFWGCFCFTLTLHSIQRFQDSGLTHTLNWFDWAVSLREELDDFWPRFHDESGVDKI